jgi:cytoskeletal protein CcmA (bactofilin family)
MWTKQPQAEVPSYSPSPVAPSQTTAAPSQSTNYAARPSAPSARSVACLGETIEVKGKISGEEDLQVDGKVEGPISLQGQRLTVGRTGKLNSEVTAREVVVYGNVHGNVRASDRVEIKHRRRRLLQGTHRNRARETKHVELGARERVGFGGRCGRLGLALTQSIIPMYSTNPRDLWEAAIHSRAGFCIRLERHLQELLGS